MRKLRIIHSIRPPVFGAVCISRGWDHATGTRRTLYLSMQVGWHAIIIEV